MRDTVVATDLEQAARIAYGPDKRWAKVVTLKARTVVNKHHYMQFINFMEQYSQAPKRYPGGATAEADPRHVVLRTCILTRLCTLQSSASA